MRFNWAAAALMAGVATASVAMAADDAPLPDRRVLLSADTDLPGGDLSSIFDVTFQGCLESCLSDAACEAVTYNQKSRACFPKGSGAGEPVAFAGAVSGRVVALDGDAQARAGARAALLDKIASADDLRAARDLARGMAAQYLPGAEPDPGARALEAEAAGDLDTAMRLMSEQIAQDDAAGSWLALARMTLSASGGDAGTAAAAGLNGWLRAEDDGEAARALAQTAQAWERQSRGRDALAALRVAAGLVPGDAKMQTALSESQDRNGFRVSDTAIETEGPQPRFCAVLSDTLSSTVDYAPFVKAADRKMAVEASGDRLCLTGVGFGQEVRMTLRAGLPSARGDTLAADREVVGYVRDRAPSVRFPGRGYVLPAGGDQGLSMVTVNADTVDLTLLRLSDRNLLRTMSEGMFAVPLDSWRASYFGDQMARQVWKGQADVAKPVGQDTLNAELTTRLAIPKAAGPLEPGIYILQAGVPGEDTDDTGVAAQWFVISDFGISTLSGSDGLTVAVRGLGDAAPKAGVEVALVSRANDVLGKVLTDADGVARFADGLTRGTDGAAPALITATTWTGEGADRVPSDVAFLSLTDPEFDLSDRGVEGHPPAPAIDLFVTTDRGAYRAGETVNLTILARDATTKAIDKLPLTAVILRPDGVEQARMAPEPAGAGGATLSWKIPDTAARGGWRIDLRAEADGPALAQARVLVEDFLPERIDFTPALPEGPARAGAALPVSLTARWLFGAPAANLPVEGRLRLAPATAVPGREGFIFGRHDDSTQPESETLPAGQTDAEGKFSVMATLPASPALRPMEAEVMLEVREGAGRPVERSETRLVMPEAPVVGLKPMFEGNALSEGGSASFQMIALGPDLAPVKTPVRWVLNKVETDYQWYALGGSWNWEPVTRRTKVAEGVVDSAADPVALAGDVEWGQYEMIAEPASGAGGGASMLFWAGWGASGGGQDTPDRLTVTLDKPGYAIGDTVVATVDAPAEGTGLVSVLSNRVVSLKAVPLSKGQNRIELPVGEDWGAGAYVTVSAIRPVAGIAPGDRTPVRALGLAYAAVDPGARKLAATLSVPAQARPRGDLAVDLAVTGAAPGQTVMATVAAVDQGILNLTGFTPPDPLDHYFGQRRLGVGLRDLYGRLILPSGAPDGAIRSGGDAQMSMNREAPPPTEKLMSWFSGPVTLDAEGKARLTVPVPDFNGEVRVMAVVWTDSAIGQADTSATVRDPVVATVTAPRFLAPGDTATVQLRLTQADGPAGAVGIAVSDKGDVALAPGALTGTKDGQVTLAEKAEAEVSLPVTAGDGEGTGRLSIALTLPDGGTATKDIAIPVVLNEPEQSRQIEVKLDPGSSTQVPPALTEGLLPGATVTLASGEFARLDVATQIARLARYPYGCTEQLTSGALPLLYLPSLSASVGVAEDGTAAKTVDGAIAQILTRQGSDGGFGLWSAETGDAWLDAYVTDFLSRARAAGHAVPDQAFKAAMARLQSHANTAVEPKSSDSASNAALAYALAVLARERAATVGDLRYYADTAAAAFDTPMSAALLGSALAAYGDQPRADRMFRQAMIQIAHDMAQPENPVWRADYGTRIRDEAAVLALAAEAGSTAVDRAALVGDVARAHADAAAKGNLPTTQEALWTVLAANGLSAKPPQVTVNGTAMPAAVTPLLTPATDVLANAGSAAVDLRLTAMGQSAETPKAFGQGYQITRSYYDLDGKPVDPAQVARGTRMAVVIEVKPTGAGGGQLVVSSPLPAGFEIDNPNLLRAGDVSSLDWLQGETEPDMVQFLQDRFNASIRWESDQPFRMAYLVRAVTPGSFRHPAASVEDMYRPARRAWTDGGTVTVTP